MTWVLDLVRMLLSIFDRMVYGLIQVFYTAFSDIARTRVLTDTTLKEFANRIYVFLALIMLFKLAFSIITYIINPDNFTNNEKGIGKLIQNVIITLLLIVLTPKIFDQAYNLQRIVLKENVFGRIILGTDSGGGDIMEDDSVHKAMSFTVLNAFLKPNTDIPLLNVDDNGITTCNNNPFPTRTETPQLDYATNSFVTCFNRLTEQTATVNGKTVGLGEAYAYAYRNNEYQLLINLITAKYSGNRDMYLFDYTYLISTIAGGFIAWIFLIFCFDIAVRSVKLSFLQLIAPIPIISYVDPKSSKSGMFQKWTKTCLSTYADLFIRLIAIYFAVYIIKIVSDSNQIFYVYGQGKPGPIITVFIIVGALMFAKQVPKLIEDITGIKLSGKFELNPLKKIGESPFAAAAVGAVGAGIGGAAANLYSGIREGRGFRRTLGSTLGGAASGLFRGGQAGLSGKGKDNAWKAVSAGLKGSVDARNLRTKRNLNGDGGIHGWVRRRGVDINNAVGIESGASAFDKEFAAYDEYLKEQQGLSTYLDKMIEKNKIPTNVSSFTYTDAAGNTQTAINENVNVLKNNIERLKTSGASAEEITNAEYKYKAALKQARKNYITSVMEGNVENGTVSAAIDTMNYIRSQNSHLDVFANDIREITRDTITDSSGQLHTPGDLWDESEGIIRGKQASRKATSEYRQAQINRRNDQNK